MILYYNSNFLNEIILFVFLIKLIFDLKYCKFIDDFKILNFLIK